MATTIRKIPRPKNLLEVGLDFDHLTDSGDGTGRAAVRKHAGLKDDSDGPSFGRVNPINRDEPWLDTMDCTLVKWRVVGVKDKDGLPIPFNRLIFAIVDAHDRPPKPKGTDRFLFRASAATGIGDYVIKQRQRNANVVWLEVKTSEPVTRVDFSMRAQHSEDGASITKARQFSN